VRRREDRKGTKPREGYNETRTDLEDSCSWTNISKQNWGGVREFNADMNEREAGGNETEQTSFDLILEKKGEGKGEKNQSQEGSLLLQSTLSLCYLHLMVKADRTYVFEEHFKGAKGGRKRVSRRAAGDVINVLKKRGTWPW